MLLHDRSLATFLVHNTSDVVSATFYGVSYANCHSVIAEFCVTY